jgi:hypothetical protein
MVVLGTQGSRAPALGREQPTVTDEHVAIRCRGLSTRSDAEAIVAQIRGNHTAGRPLGHGLPAEISWPLERVVQVVVNDRLRSPSTALGHAQTRLDDRRRPRPIDDDEEQLLAYLRRLGDGPYGVHSLMADVWGVGVPPSMPAWCSAA